MYLTHILIGRGKMKKMMGMMMMGAMMKMAAMVPMAIAGLYMLAGKALIISKVFKQFFQQNKPQCHK
jgi:hypothetical protein